MTSPSAAQCQLESQYFIVDKAAERADTPVVDESNEQIAASFNQRDDEGQPSSDENKLNSENVDNNSEEEDEIYLLNIADELRDDFRRDVELKMSGSAQVSLTAQIDTRCPITLVREQVVNTESVTTPGKEWNRYRGINDSKLWVKGVTRAEVTIEGRDVLKLFGYRLTNSSMFDKAVSEILCIESYSDTEVERLEINPKVDAEFRDSSYMLYRILISGPNELPKVKAILMLSPPNTLYLVLTKKKNGDTRMCVDYCALNKVLARDNCPLPLIEDQFDALRGKRYYSTLDLKDGFYHIAMAPESIKYTAFITPMGQFEFVRMPFGIKFGPQLFQRFINEVMADLVKRGDVVVYMDDILVASKTLDSHIETLKKVYTVLNRVRPTDKGIAAVQNFPKPRTVKEVHSFVGLASYFRKFIKNFSLIARPLYELLKKDVPFRFGQTEKMAFETLKTRLVESPILAVYNPRAYTELHCDASSHGFGAVLLQRQGNDAMHPVFYFSRRITEVEAKYYGFGAVLLQRQGNDAMHPVFYFRRITEVEAKYHSFELETLAIVYTFRRFRIYLQGTQFVVVSDCNAVTQTLEKWDINAQIARWNLELQNFDFRVVHRPGSRMAHVDALSRAFGVLVVEDNPFEWNLAVLQNRDSIIKDIISKLESKDDPQYEMRDGLVYKKHGGKSLFMIPRQMESPVLVRYHNEMGHIGPGRMIDVIRRTYWFPHIREKCEDHVRRCLKCISFSPTSGKEEGYLNPIPKGRLPFETLHINHFGPVDRQVSSKKYVLAIVDAFSKFVRLFATKTTGTKETTACLTQFFQSYSKPQRIISDRGSSFTSQEFEKFMKKQGIQHIKVAVGSPQANGQAERINRVLAPCIAKLSNPSNGWQRYNILHEVEYSINNAVNRSTGKSPSQLVFGIDQRGPHPGIGRKTGSS
ncbi:PREDICTED: uncharacterized protein K02A2.6-like [Trachymyrmex cornetzi]|uniref:uncharacterized protein K02A2.6-like n=1 Tax=Trachymyrmex cornetzi TaxID=471704 RepID=UPI00084F7DB0|nr:PREDICTED: uncharacterized protein K02A2.6-like [Trachymyrmex cornetzi]